MVYALTVLSQLIILYFISRHTTNLMFYFLKRFIANNHLIFTLVALAYLPGTIVHEMSQSMTTTKGGGMNFSLKGN